MLNSIGEEIFALASKLFPICRSLTGNGVRETLNCLKEHLPDLSIFEVPSGTRCFDWTVPKEWNIDDAYIIDPDGKKILSFQDSNLHVVGYSIPVDLEISLEDLQAHLHSLPQQSTAIPYITSYYKETWGFCLRHDQRLKLKRGVYRVVIRSRLEPGNLTYGELILPGTSTQEIFLSTYICHPSMANNEVSGPSVATYVAKWVMSLPNRHFTYRIIFIPETIGSITYLSRHLDQMKSAIIAGFNITCVGDNRAYSYLPSRAENTLADRVALHVLKHTDPSFKRYSYSSRGSDERQYCSPGVDLPVASVMRSKYAEYPEYHTSLDNLDVISSEGLGGAFEVLKKCLHCLENNFIYYPTVLCEPQLGKRGLYPSVSTRDTHKTVIRTLDLLAYCDGTKDLVAVAEKIDVPVWEIIEIAANLYREGLFSLKKL